MSFVTDVETFFVTYSMVYVTAVPVVTYVDCILCAVMTAACIITSGVRIMTVIKIGVLSIVISNTPSHDSGT